jgi:hypothetical protein
MAAQKQRGKPAGLGPPGLNALFVGVCGAVIIGVVAGASSSNTKKVLGSNVVFRLVVGGIVFAIAYAAVAALWFAWHRRTFKGLHLGGIGADAPAQDVDSETAARDQDIAAFMETTTEAIADLSARLGALE